LLSLLQKSVKSAFDRELQVSGSTISRRLASFSTVNVRQPTLSPGNRIGAKRHPSSLIVQVDPQLEYQLQASLLLRIITHWAV
jgi:hypothetical protein